MKTEIVCPIPSSDAEKNPRNSEGSFIKLKDGRIAFYYTRYRGKSFSDHATADVVVRYSSDNGESWSDFETVIKGPENGNVMSVSLLRLQDGRIMMMYLRKDKHTADAFYDCRPTFIFSSDEGVTWTEPETIADIPVYFVGNNDRLVQLSSGRILYPVAFHNWINSGGIVFVYYSDDNGKSWRPSSWILPPADQEDKCTGLQEPGVIELDDGSVMCWHRTNYHCQWKCFSSDGGVNWTCVEPAEEFPSNLAPMQIKRNPYTGEYVAVWNDTSVERWQVEPDYSNWASSRNRLVVAFSSDCKNWHGHETLEFDRDAGFCYPAMEFTDDGGILLAYCCGGHGKICLQDLCIRKIQSC